MGHIPRFTGGAVGFIMHVNKSLLTRWAEGAFLGSIGVGWFFEGEIIMGVEPANVQLATELRHELHAHPELSLRERWTRRRLLSFLRESTRSLQIVDPGKGYFYAKYLAGADAPTVAFRADFDALPIDEGIDVPWKSRNAGVSHKCGHDGHASTLACFALEVDQKGAGCNVVLLFQDAEEIGAGAPIAKEVLAVEGVQEVYGLHNWSQMEQDCVHLIDGPIMPASKGMTVHMVGAPSHASQPEDGINPVFALSEIVQALGRLTDPRGKKGYVMCTVVQLDVGALNFGVQAGEGSLSMTLRAQYEDELDQLQRSIQQMARRLASDASMEVDFSFHDEFPAVINDEACADKVRAACEMARVPWRNLPSPSPIRSSEDFGNYTNAVPGCLFYVGNGMEYPPIHTTEFDFRDANIEIGVKVFCALAGVGDGFPKQPQRA